MSGTRDHARKGVDLCLPSRDPVGGTEHVGGARGRLERVRASSVQLALSYFVQYPV
jgi:hypothetical protein